MKELITRIEELAVQLEAANRQIEISATDARDALGQLNRANKKLVEMHDDGNRLRDELDQIRAAAKHYGRFDGNAVMIITQAANDEAMRRSNGEMVSQLRAEVETLKHERDSAINECERVRTEGKATIGELRAHVELFTQGEAERLRAELAAILVEANKSGRCGGDPVALLKQGQVDRDTAESLDRQLGSALSLSNERIRKLMDGHVEDMAIMAAIDEAADACGRTEGESVVEFMKRVKQETRYT